MLQEKTLVICDPQRQYARNLLQMFIRYEPAKFQMYLFHTWEDLSGFMGKKSVQVLLIAGEFRADRRRELKAEKIYVLVKDRREPLLSEETGIGRYQSAKKIWEQIQKEKEKKPPAENGVKTEKEKRAPGKVRPEKTMRKKGTAEGVMQEKADVPSVDFTSARTDKKGSRLIGVYSPVHRIGKTQFALQLGKELAKKEPVLYLNLEEYSGAEYYFPQSHGKTLADLLYYVRQEKGNLGLRISTMAGQYEELDYILPMPYLQDLQDVSWEEWVKLFHQILEHCIYRKVILDLGDSICGLFQILKACDVIYMPYIEEETAHAKMNQYAENLRKSGMECVLEKTIQQKMDGMEKRKEAHRKGMN